MAATPTGQRPTIAAEAFLRLQDDKAGARALVGQMIAAADARDPGTHDQDIDVLGHRVAPRRLGRQIARA